MQGSYLNVHSMKIQLPTFTGSFIKSPEMTNKAPALSELERHMIGAVMVETDASANDYAFSIANHRRLPHVQAVQRDIRNPTYWCSIGVCIDGFLGGFSLLFNFGLLFELLTSTSILYSSQG